MLVWLGSAMDEESLTIKTLRASERSIRVGGYSKNVGNINNVNKKDL